jgi:transposase
VSAFPSIITEQHVQQILSRYEAGEQIRDVCKDYHVSNVTLYKRIIATAEDAWKELQVARAFSRKELAEAELDKMLDSGDSDDLSVARAKIASDALRSAQWDLERVCRRIYGQEPAQVLGAGLVQINIGITRADAAVLAVDKPAIAHDAGSDKTE